MHARACEIGRHLGAWIGRQAKFVEAVLYPVEKACKYSEIHLGVRLQRAEVFAQSTAAQASGKGEGAIEKGGRPVRK